MKKIILNNGMRVIFYPMTNTHSITVGLYIRAGVAYTEPINGITHLLEHLHFRQLGCITQRNLYYQMESIGSTLRATTYRDFLKFSMKIVPCYLDDCLSIFFNLIEANEWDNVSFQKEKKVVLNQITETVNYISLEEKVRKRVFGDHPLAMDIMGLKDQIDTISLKDISDYKKKIFNSADVLLCITGQLSENDLMRIIRCFEMCTIQPQISKKILSYPPSFQKRKPDIDFWCVEDDNLLDVNLSFDVNYTIEDKDFLTILNCILGEGVGSRLQAQIREEKCYSSDIVSYIEWYKDFAIIHIRFSVKKKFLLPCLKEVIEVINDVKENITKEDLAVSLPFYTTNHVFNEDDTEEMNFQLAYYRLIFESDYKAIELQNQKSTAIRIQSIAQRIFKANNLCVVIVGNTKKITKKSVIQIVANL